MVVAGDQEGKVGVGFGKANQVPDAFRKAQEKARASMITAPLQEGTIPHDVIGNLEQPRLSSVGGSWYRCNREFTCPCNP